MEDGKNLESTIEEIPGVEEATCIESAVRNWRDPTLHSNYCKVEAYKPEGEIVSQQEGSRRSP